jgi:DNA polymerase III delta prime subunit
MVGNAPQAARLHKWLQAWSAKIDRDRNAALTSALASSSVSFFGANEPANTTPVSSTSSTNAVNAVAAAATEPKPALVAEPVAEPVAQPESAPVDADDEAFEAESSSRSRRFRSRLRRSTVIDDDGDADTSEQRNSKKRRAAQADENEDDDFAPARASRKKAPAAEAPAADPAQTSDETIYDLDNLFTAMILTGPLGVGKSATVYACARSLGFEVLEINPGTLRSGKAVTALFGEASQSHRIRPGSISAFAALANPSSTPTVAVSATTTPKESTPTGNLKSMFGAKPAVSNALSKADQAPLANNKAASKNSVISMFAKAPATSTSTASAPAAASSTSAARSNSPSVVVPAPPPKGSIQSFIQRKSAPAVSSVLLEAPAPVIAPIKVDTEPPAKKMFARRSVPLDSDTSSTSQTAISLVDSPVLLNTPASKSDPIVVSSTPDVTESGGRRSSRVQHLQQVQSERKEAQAKLEAELEAAKPLKAARKRRQTEDSPTEVDDADEVEVTMTICENAKQPPKAPTFKAYFAQLFSDPPAASLFQLQASEAPADALQALLNNKPAATTARKTLIVFEETDTVFDEDQGFYRALKQLIRTTKCPVVMTGNGTKIFICLFIHFLNPN